MFRWWLGRLDELGKLIQGVQSTARSLSEANVMPTPEEDPAGEP